MAIFNSYVKIPEGNHHFSIHWPYISLGKERILSRSRAISHDKNHIINGNILGNP